MTVVATLQKPDLLEQLANHLQRERRLLAQALEEHDASMRIFCRLSSEAEEIAKQTWPPSKGAAT